MTLEDELRVRLEGLLVEEGSGSGLGVPGEVAASDDEDGERVLVGDARAGEGDLERLAGLPAPNGHSYCVKNTHFDCIAKTWRLFFYFKK